VSEPSGFEAEMDIEKLTYKSPHIGPLAAQLIPAY
jgi:hypothetical protein